MAINLESYKSSKIFFAQQNEPQTISFLDGQTDNLLTFGDEALFFLKNFLFEGSTFLIDVFLNYECGVQVAMDNTALGICET
jgi:hypothetical protein